MSLFDEQIASAAPTPSDVREREWVYVQYDRLTDQVGPLSRLAPENAGIVMMEAMAKARRRLYHKKKLTLILASQRHFALEQARRGVKVAYLYTSGIFADGLQLAEEKYGFGPLRMIEPAEREMRLDIEEAEQRGIELIREPDPTWLSTNEDCDAVYGKPDGPVTKLHLMDRFYRHMREKTGSLMRNGKPEGGQFSFDEQNRQPYKGSPGVPKRRRFTPDAITREVVELVEREFPTHFGRDAEWDMPMAVEEIEEAWRWSLEHLLPLFGPYEDAMHTAEPDLFHSKMSAFINISRLLPARVVGDVVKAADKGLIPLASAEGFLRQLLGWREFMRHMHRVTGGYRNITTPSEPPRRAQSPRREAAPDVKPAAAALPDEGARPSALGANLPLPAAYWGTPSGLHCLDTVVKQVIDEGWSHHITRLMVLSNFAVLAGYSPRELTDWFCIGYIDAYDWVVEPNVLGMATFADGGLTATKPYVSGAAYINKMSNYCGHCRFNPKLASGEGSCPFTALYWTFLERHEQLLGANGRMRMQYNTLRKKPAAERIALRERAERCILELGKARY